MSEVSDGFSSYYSEYEEAAREWCRLTGLDPDYPVSHGADPGPGGATMAILLHSPRWQRVTRELRRADLIRKALEAKPARSAEKEQG